MYSAAAPKTDDGQEPADPVHAKRILVAEDDPSLRKLLERTLAHAGYDVVACEDGEDALECAKRCDPDLLLLDIMMPRVNGLSVARQLSRDAKTRSIPVIFVSAMGSQYSVSAGMTAGAHSYITKPFNIPKLVDKVARIIG